MLFSICSDINSNIFWQTPSEDLLELTIVSELQEEQRSMK